MQQVWAVIFSVVLLLIIYGIVSSKLQARRQRAAREKQLPFVQETIRPGTAYHVCLSDGRTFRDVELLGTNDPGLERVPFGGWDGMLVLRLPSGKRVFVRQASVRYVEEA